MASFSFHPSIIPPCPYKKWKEGPELSKYFHKGPGTPAYFTALGSVCLYPVGPVFPTAPAVGASAVEVEAELSKDVVSWETAA